MAPLIGLALVLITVLLLLFTRTIADMLLTLTGLIFAIACTVGSEGWLGPNGLGLIGPPSSLTAMVPVILISLTVDYAIQTVSHYREQRVEGKQVAAAVRVGLRHVTVPLTLAAVTTIVSLLATLFSPIGVIGDFGVVAGLGVGDQPGGDADPDTGRSDDHRPAARVARHAEARPPYRKRIARHPQGCRAAWAMGDGPTGALPSRGGTRHDWPRVRRDGAGVRIQHQGHPAPAEEACWRT